jgi:hypothetical protein
MEKSGKRIGIGMAAALLLAGITTGARAQAVPSGGLSSFGGESRGITEFKGKVVCVGCSLEEVQAAHPDQHGFHQLSHRKGQVVMEVDTVSEPQVWSYFALPPRIAVRGEDKLFEKLTVEKNLFKEVDVTGLLRNMRTLDMFGVTVKG